MKLLYSLAVFFLIYRLAFRSLVRLYDCHLCFTPMIIADSFIKSSKARNSEFTTNKGMNHIFLKLNCDQEVPIQLHFAFVELVCSSWRIMA
jgi:tRNA-dihydrouridine synthase